MRRVHIVGGPGTGKADLAGQIAACLQVEPVDLTQLAFIDGYGKPVPVDERIAAAEELAETDGWVSYGLSLGWTEPLFLRADLVIWMNPKPRSAMRRLFSRHFGSSLFGRHERRGVIRFVSFMRWARSYFRRSMARKPTFGPSMDSTKAATEWVMRDYRHKMKECRTAQDVEAVLRWVRAESVENRAFNRS
jgi:adenylate kinase family enzyme